MIYMISYDVSCAKRRAEIVDILKSYQWSRVQKSVYFSTEDEKYIDTILKKIEQILNKKEDKLIVLPLCRDDIEKSFFLECGGKRVVRMRERSYIE